jgi:hypothetical protein
MRRRLPVAVVLAALFAAAFASAASASSGFEAESYPVTLKGEKGTLTFSMGGNAFICEGSGFEANMEGAAKRIYTSHVNDYSCTHFGVPGYQLMMSGCNLSLRPGEFGKENAGLEIGPFGCGPIALNSGSTTCLTFNPQSAPAATSTVTPEGSGNNRSMTLQLNASAMEWTSKGGLCGTSSGTFNNAFLNFQWKIRAQDVASNSVGLWFTEEFKGSPHAPRFEANSYPATLTGGGLGKLVVDSGIFECAKTGLEAKFSAATSQLSDVEASYGECALAISGGSEVAATVTMNSCHYTLGVQNLGPPYAGTWGVACSKEGDTIEYLAFLAGKYRTCITVGPQSGLTGIGLSNSGGGIGLFAEVKNLAYQRVGLCKGEKNSLTNGVMSGSASLSGGKLTGEGP